MNYKNDQEQTLLKIIEKFQRQMDEFNKHKKQNMSVVLLVGVTGSGKSTIFNFQSGADFIINDKKQLEIKNPSNNFSKMFGGMNSITKEPNFYHNSQNNHLIIDFPGFQDTSGDWDQLLFELLFYKIVTSGPIKIIYVIKNPENSLPNRGSDLQEFIKQICLQGRINIQKFNLILNCYLEDLSDEELQNSVKEDLRAVNILQSIDKILVLRKAKKNDEIQTIFNNEQRQTLWQQIEQMQSIKIQPQKLPKSEIISEYLRYTTLKTIEKYGSGLCDIFDNKYTQLTDAQNRATQVQMQKLLDVIKKENKGSPLDWYINFISICEQLTTNLTGKSDLSNRSNNFKKIFTYFSQFSDLIKGYDEMKIIKSIAEDQLNKIEKIISTRIAFLKKAEQDKAAISKIESEKYALQRNINQSQSQITSLQKRIQSSEWEHNQEIQQLKTQIESAQKQHNNLDVYEQRELQRQAQRQEEEIQMLKDQLKEFKQQKQNEQDLKQTINYYNQKIGQMEKQIDDIKKRPNSQSSSSNSSCQLI
ncbi:unnamed protein product [Paramecium primaurelia]|uniref:G domain-containing protein n=1 Tax=Paramecium primaurelia TaxID=5886 RepID=A0A8S1MK07_PARPR|nr:unnamed protein product [Paramecium primaurelia]